MVQIAPTRVHDNDRHLGRELEDMMISTAPGVMPDRISANPHADSWLVFVDLAANTNVQTWLSDVVTPAVDKLVAPQTEGEDTVAVVTTAFGTTLFQRPELAGQRPAGLANSVMPAEVMPDDHDVLFYIFSLSDAPVADFIRAIATGPSIAKTQLERGYQRANRREVFGQVDGLRNVIPKEDRANVAFVPAGQPDEPDWISGGSYLAYLKIRQDVAAWQQLSSEQREAAMGRREDGSRLDVSPGTPPKEEHTMTAGSTPPALASHVRKAGPRGNAQEDAVRILRRGTPFIESDGDSLVEGLHFVSYQANLDDFVTILRRWMLNEGFPAAGTGRDALFAATGPLASFQKGGIYFAAPLDDRFVGAGLFDPASATTGVLHIRVTVHDASDQTDLTASVEGAVFEVSDGGTGSWTATTNASGRASIPGLPLGMLLTVTEGTPPSGSTAPVPQTAILQRSVPAELIFVNQKSGTPGVYTG